MFPHTLVFAADAASVSNEIGFGERERVRGREFITWLGISEYLLDLKLVVFHVLQML